MCLLVLHGLGRDLYTIFSKNSKLLIFIDLLICIFILFLIFSYWKIVALTHNFGRYVLWQSEHGGLWSESSMQMQGSGVGSSVKWGVSGAEL